MKECNQCHIKLVLDNFYKHPKGTNGLMAICKECLKSNMKKYRLTESFREVARVKMSQYRKLNN